MSKRLDAIVTFVWFQSRVESHVTLQAFIESECLATHVTHTLLISRVDTHVIF